MAIQVLSPHVPPPLLNCAKLIDKPVPLRSQLHILPDISFISTPTNLRATNRNFYWTFSGEFRLEATIHNLSRDIYTASAGSLNRLLDRVCPCTVEKSRTELARDPHPALSAGIKIGLHGFIDDLLPLGDTRGFFSE